MNLRALALALVITLPGGVILSPAAPLSGPRAADASVSVLASLDEMIAASSYAVVATAGEQRSVWEELGGGRRIVTYTKLTVERAIFGAPGKEIWVRTLGGRVDRIGQAVAGEAQITPGSRALLFLANVDKATVVTALAQGHYPLVRPEAKAPERLAPSPDAGLLLPRRGPTISARERLVGATLDDAVDLIQRAKAAHEKR